MFFCAWPSFDSIMFMRTGRLVWSKTQRTSTGQSSKSDHSNCCSLGVTSDNILRSNKERERMSDSPAMISAPRLCPQCGSEIPADAPEGGCPGCLLETALDAAALEGAVRFGVYEI